ncbi:sensor histidine kinase [Streptomyces sp. NPDC005808]|uniref:sensor histidine kinase n=1 Tax=Streptomyces sp. NPDC005808 TaxID=3364734 RepID=UPI0036874B18
MAHGPTPKATRPRTPRLTRRPTLRVTLTALVTVAVGLVLTLASVVLVTGMSHTLIGDVKAAAVREVDRVADELAGGKPATDRRYSPVEVVTVIRVEDESGRIVQTIPELPTGAPEDRPTARPPGEPVQTPAEDLVVASRTVVTPDGVRTVSAVSRLGPVSRSIDLVVRALWIGTPVLTAFVGLLTWFTVDRALRPVEAIRKRAEAISHSTLGERLPRPRTGDEVERLTTTLNAMLDRIDEGARRQREFVSDASHELRTPLAAIRAELEVSLAHRGPDDWRGVAGRLLDDHRRLDRLTGDLLILARTEDSAVSRRAETVRLDEVVAGELVAVSRVEVVASLGQPVEVTGVVAELARLARNLLDNADRHAAGRVEVRVGTAGGRALLSVDDDGPGIPVEQRARVFERFVRLGDGSRARGDGGVGLGLAMVRGIARRHGGDVTVTESPLGGARFEVQLPLSPAQVV